jgi:glucan phosphoethanolaminetransferase (alkaline phosphatase superfamily)
VLRKSVILPILAPFIGYIRAITHTTNNNKQGQGQVQLDNLVFSLIGIITGLGSSLLLFRFDAGWLKALSLSGGAGILIGEFVLLSDFFEITKENRSEVISYFLIAWIVTFLLALPILLHLLKRQESKYKIHTWEILFGDKKALDATEKGSVTNTNC